jgi:hypothetical protein
MSRNEEHYLGNPLLKRANVSVELSQDQLLELVKCSDDPNYFAKNYIKIVTLDQGLVNFEPYPFQEKMLDNFHNNRFNICKLPRQPLALDTPIPTTKGWATMESIGVGDYVYNPEGIPVKIIKKSQTFYNTQCYKISFSSGESIIADEEHLWEINKTENKVLKIKTLEIYRKFIGNKFFIRAAKIPDNYVVNKNNNPENKKHFITNIQKVESVPVACITVNSDAHLFVCGKNFIATGNSGKSTTTVAYLVHNMLFNEHTSIAILANKAQTAKDILSRFQTAYENLPKWMQQGVKSCNKTSMELENGSKVIAASTSASAVRGGTYSLLMLDEYAFVPEQIANNFMRSVYPTITSGQNSKVIIISTPSGLNHYYKLWIGAKEKSNEYQPFEIHWSDVPGRDEKWKQQQIANIGQKAFDQEFNTEFLGSSETLISGSTLSNLVNFPPLKSINSLDVYEEPKNEHLYFTIVDTARGVEKDYHAFTVIDASELPYKLVAKYRNNEIKPEMYSYIVKDVSTKYNISFILCEVNDIGYQVARDLVEDGYPNMLMCSTKARSGQFIGQNLSGKYELGVKMQKNIKKVGALKLKTLIEESKLISNDFDVFSELTTFIQKGTTFEAEVGKNDDLVVCLLLFSWLTTNQYFKDLTDIDLRKKLLQEKQEKEEIDVLPFGCSTSAEDDNIIDEKKGVIWQIVNTDEMETLLDLYSRGLSDLDSISTMPFLTPESEENYDAALFSNYY